MDNLSAKIDRLHKLLEAMGRVVVAYSGGVDSAVVARAAHVALGESAIAVTGVSESLASGELEQARETARLIGIRHEVLETREFADPAYLQNDARRCYHCKTELYSQLAAQLTWFGPATILNGANLDDLGDYRPGMLAAKEHAVRSPLAECGLTKTDVRALAHHWGLPVWDKPAAPCLSSRVAYGEEVTPERLRMIDLAEQFLRGEGLATLRVRYHRGDLARIEVPPEAIAKLAELDRRERLVRHFKSLGFKFVTLDLTGFQSGSLNQVLPVESLLNRGG